MFSIYSQLSLVYCAIHIHINVPLEIKQTRNCRDSSSREHEFSNIFLFSG